jgi:hypothetical protein
LQFSIRDLFAATALFAVAIFLVIWAETPVFPERAQAWELQFFARMAVIPLICGSIGAGTGLLIGRLWAGLTVGLAAAAFCEPFMFLWIWWF